MQDKPRQPAVAAAAGSSPSSQAPPNISIAEQEQLFVAAPQRLTTENVQQLEQQVGPGLLHASSAQHPAQTHAEQAEPAHGLQPQTLHQRSPLGLVSTSSIRKDSVSSSASSAPLLGRMSGVSLQRPDFTASSGHQPQARQYLEQQVLQQQAQAQAAAAAGVQLPANALQQQQQPSGGSTTSSPPLSPRRLARHSSACPSVDGSGSIAMTSMQPVPPQALGLPAIATTMPVPIPGTSPPTGSGASPRGNFSPRQSVKSLSITPQESLAAAAAMQNAVLAAAHAQQQLQLQQLQQQQQQQSQQPSAPASVGGAHDTDDDLESSSDDDDNYEFGEQKIKRTFTRQQRRQKREQQQLLAQQQAAAASLLQQQQLQAQVQLAQQQAAAAELQAQLLLQQQQVAGGSGALSPTAQGGSPSVATAAAAAAVEAAAAVAAGTTAGAMASANGTSPLLAAALGNSPPGTPQELAGTSVGSAAGSTAGAAAAVAAAAAAVQQQQAAEQQAALPAALAAQQQQQQQQQQVTSPGAAHAAALEGLLLQVPPSVEWASAVPQAAAAGTGAVAAGVPACSAGGGNEPSFVPVVLEQTVSGTSAVSNTSGRSTSKHMAGGSPVLGSSGGAPAAAWLKAAAGAGVDLAGSLGSARNLNVLGSSVAPVQMSGASFLARQQMQGTCLGGVDGASLAAGVAAGMDGSGGGAGGAAGAAAAGAGGGADGGKKDQAELKAEFQGLSLFNEEDDDDEGEGEEEHTKWYKRTRVWLRIAALSMSAILLMVGVLTHNVEGMKRVNNSGVQLFRWMYFFAIWPVLWMAVSFTMNKLFAFIEWWFYREALFYLDSVRRTARGLIFMCLILPWFVVCFWEAWCGESGCEAQGSYKQATDIVWKLMVCLTLFSLANFLKSVLTKLLSSHFYKTAHFMKVKAAIEKEYWLLMLSQPRPAPKPISEPPLSRLSHFMYNAPSMGNGHQGPQGAADAGEHGVVPRALSDTGGLGSKLRRRNKAARNTADTAPPKHGLSSFWSRKDDRPGLSHTVSCGNLGQGTTYAAGQHLLAGTEHELTLSRGAAAGLASIATAPKGPDSNEATPTLTPDFSARIVVSGFNIEVSSASRTAARLDTSPSSFSAGHPAAAAGSGMSFGTPAPGQSVSARVGSLSTQVQPGQAVQSTVLQAQQAQLAAGQQFSSTLEKARSSSLRWAHMEADAAAAAGAGPVSEVNLQPFRPDANRVDSGSEGDADEKGAQQGTRWGFWRRLGTQKEQALLPEGQVPSSPASQHTLTIQEPGQGVESSSPSKRFNSGFSSVFASPSAQQQQIQQQQQQQQHRLNVTRVNSAMSRKPSAALAVGRRSTDMGGAAGSVAARAAGPVAGSAAAVTSDPLLQAGLLEAVNLGKQVDTSTIKPAEWERLRTGIALKTFTALMKRYQNLSDAEEAKKLRDARRFAKGLFYHVRGPCMRRYLVRDDFTPFFASKESADAAFAYFDKDNDATLSLKEMKDSVAAIFKERKNMAASLKDTDSIVNTLEFGIGFLLHFIFAAIYLLVWGMDIVKGFSTFSATVLALTFIFGNSVRQIFESMLFLFVEHAFDVGDLLEVELVNYRVKKIDLMYTVLVKSTGERCYYPNTRLITLPVVNLTRSCARSEKVVISLNVGQASNAAREALLAAVKAHYEENESDFNSCPSVNFVNLVDPFKAQLSVTWTYNFSADETKRTSMVKTGLLQVIHSCLGNLPHLEYTLVRSNNSAGNGINQQGDSDSDDGTQERSGQKQQQGLGAGVADRQAANMATMGAAALGVGMLGGTAMMGTAGLAML